MAEGLGFAASDFWFRVVGSGLGDFGLWVWDLGFRVFKG